MDFKDRLRYYREQRGYSSDELAKLLDIPYTTLKGYENAGREPKYNILVKIADILNVSLDDLLGRTPTNEDERLKKVVSDLLSKFAKENDIKLHEIKYKKEFEKYIDKSKLFFTVYKNLYASINKVNFIDKLNNIEMFTKEFKDKLIYYCIIKYLFTELSFDLDDDIKELDELSKSKDINFNDKPLATDKSQDLIKKDIEYKKIQYKLMNNSIELADTKAMLSLKDVIEFIQEIEKKINQETKEVFKEHKKKELELINELEKREKDTLERNSKNK